MKSNHPRRTKNPNKDDAIATNERKSVGSAAPPPPPQRPIVVTQAQEEDGDPTASSSSAAAPTLVSHRLRVPMILLAALVLASASLYSSSSSFSGRGATTPTASIVSFFSLDIKKEREEEEGEGGNRKEGEGGDSDEITSSSVEGKANEKALSSAGPQQPPAVVVSTTTTNQQARDHSTGTPAAARDTIASAISYVALPGEVAVVLTKKGEMEDGETERNRGEAAISPRPPAAPATRSSTVTNWFATPHMTMDHTTVTHKAIRHLPTANKKEAENVGNGKGNRDDEESTRGGGWSLSQTMTVMGTHRGGGGTSHDNNTVHRPHLLLNAAGAGAATTTIGSEFPVVSPSALSPAYKPQHITTDNKKEPSVEPSKNNNNNYYGLLPSVLFMKNDVFVDYHHDHSERRGRDDRLLLLPRNNEDSSPNSTATTPSTRFAIIAPLRADELITAEATSDDHHQHRRRPPRLESLSLEHGSRRWFRDKLSASLLFDWLNYFTDPIERAAIVRGALRQQQQQQPPLASSSPTKTTSYPTLQEQLTAAAGEAETSGSGALLSAKAMNRLMSAYRRHVLGGGDVENTESMPATNNNEKGKYKDEEESDAAAATPAFDGIRIAIVSHHGFHDDITSGGNNDDSKEGNKEEKTIVAKSGEEKQHQQQQEGDSRGGGGADTNGVGEEKRGEPKLSDDVDKQHEKKLKREKKSPPSSFNKYHRVVRGACPPLQYYANTRYAATTSSHQHHNNNEGISNAGGGGDGRSGFRPTIRELIALERSEEEAMTLRDADSGDDSGHLPLKKGGNDMENDRHYRHPILSPQQRPPLPQPVTLRRQEPMSAVDNDLKAYIKKALLLHQTASPLGGTANGSTARTKNGSVASESPQTPATIIAMEFDYSNLDLSLWPSGGGTGGSNAYRPSLMFATDRPWAAMAELPHIFLTFRFEINGSSSLSKEEKQSSSISLSDEPSSSTSSFVDIIVNGCELMYHLTTDSDRTLVTEALIAPIALENIITHASATDSGGVQTHNYNLMALLLPHMNPPLYPTVMGVGGMGHPNGGNHHMTTEEKAIGVEMKKKIATLNPNTAFELLQKKLSFDFSHGAGGSEGKGSSGSSTTTADHHHHHRLVGVSTRRMYDPTHPTAFSPGRLIQTARHYGEEGKRKVGDNGFEAGTTTTTPSTKRNNSNSSFTTSSHKHGNEGVDASLRTTAIYRRHYQLQSIVDGHGRPSTSTARIGSMGSTPPSHGDRHWSPDLPSNPQQASVIVASGKYGLSSADSVVPVRCVVSDLPFPLSNEGGNDKESLARKTANSNDEKSKTRRVVTAYAADPLTGTIQGVHDGLTAPNANIGVVLPVAGDAEGKTSFMRNASILNKLLYGNVYGYDVLLNDDDVEETREGEVLRRSKTDYEDIDINKKMARTSTTAEGRSGTSRSEGLRGRPPYWSKTVYLHRAMKKRNQKKKITTRDDHSSSNHAEEEKEEEARYGAEVFDDLLLSDYFGDLYEEFVARSSAARSSSSSSLPLSLRNSAERQTVATIYNNMIQLLVDVAIGVEETKIVEGGGDAPPSSFESEYRYGGRYNPPIELPSTAPSLTTTAFVGEAATTKYHPTNAAGEQQLLAAKHRAYLIETLTLPTTVGAATVGVPAASDASVVVVVDSKKKFNTIHKPLLAQLFQRFLRNKAGLQQLQQGVAAEGVEDETTLFQCDPAADIHLNEVGRRRRRFGGNNGNALDGPNLTVPAAATSIHRPIVYTFSDGSRLSLPNGPIINKNVAAYYGVPLREWAAQKQSVLRRMEEREEEEEGNREKKKTSVSDSSSSSSSDEERSPSHYMYDSSYCYHMLQADVMRVLFYSGHLSHTVLLSSANIARVFLGRVDDDKSVSSVDGGMDAGVLDALLKEEAAHERDYYYNAAAQQQQQQQSSSNGGQANNGAAQNAATAATGSGGGGNGGDPSLPSTSVAFSGYFPSGRFNLAQQSLPRRLPAASRASRPHHHQQGGNSRSIGEGSSPVPPTVGALGLALLASEHYYLPSSQGVGGGGKSDDVVVSNSSNSNNSTPSSSPSSSSSSSASSNHYVVNVPAEITGGGHGGVQSHGGAGGISSSSPLSIHDPSSAAHRRFALTYQFMRRREHLVWEFSNHNDMSLLATFTQGVVVQQRMRMRRQQRQKGEGGRRNSAMEAKESLTTGSPPSHIVSPPPPLSEEHMYDFSLWIDNDAIITNMTIPLEALLYNVLMGDRGRGAAYAEDTVVKKRGKKLKKNINTEKEGNGVLADGGVLPPPPVWKKGKKRSRGHHGSAPQQQQSALAAAGAGQQRKLLSFSSDSDPVAETGVSQRDEDGANDEEEEESEEVLFGPANFYPHPSSASTSSAFSSAKYLESLNSGFPLYGSKNGAAVGGGGHKGEPFWEFLGRLFDEEVLMNRNKEVGSDGNRTLATATHPSSSPSSSRRTSSSSSVFPIDLRVPFDRLFSPERDAAVTRERWGSNGVGGGLLSSSSGGEKDEEGRKSVNKETRRKVKAFLKVLSELLMPSEANVTCEGEEEETTRSVGGSATVVVPTATADTLMKDSALSPPLTLLLGECRMRRQRYYDALESIGAAVPYLVGNGVGGVDGTGNRRGGPSSADHHLPPTLTGGPPSPLNEALYALRDGLSFGGTVKRRRLRFLANIAESHAEFQKLSNLMNYGYFKAPSRKKVRIPLTGGEIFSDYGKSLFEDLNRKDADARASPPHLVDVITTSQASVINNGIFFLRNSPWVRDYFLPLWWHSPNNTWMWFDNGGFIHTFSDECVGKPQAIRNRQHLAVGPARTFNSYFRGGNFKTSNLAALDRLFKKRDLSFSAQYYQPGDWNIHFPTFGPYDLQSRFFCESLRRNKYILMAQGKLSWEELTVQTRRRRRRGRSGNNTAADHHHHRRGDRGLPLLSFERYPLTAQCRRDLMLILDMVLPTE